MADDSKDKMEVIRDRTFSKVLWGERDELVIEFLKGEGLTGLEIGDLLTEAKEERDRVLRNRVRRRGVLKILFGILMLIVFAILPWFYGKRPELLENPRAKIVVALSIVAWTATLFLTGRTIYETVTSRVNNDEQALKE